MIYTTNTVLLASKLHAGLDLDNLEFVRNNLHRFNDLWLKKGGEGGHPHDNVGPAEDRDEQKKYLLIR